MAKVQATAIKKQKKTPAKKTSVKTVKTAKPKHFKSIKEEGPKVYIIDEKNVGAAILESLKRNDSEGVIEALEIYLNAVNKTNFLKQKHVHYRFKNRNPTIKTLATLVHKYFQKP